MGRLPKEQHPSLPEKPAVLQPLHSLTTRNQTGFHSPPSTSCLAHGCSKGKCGPGPPPLPNSPGYTGDWEPQQLFQTPLFPTWENTDCILPPLSGV